MSDALDKKEQKAKDIESHDYDGIKELSNPSPYWIVILFLVTIGFSLVYVVNYFGYPDNGMDQVSEYEQKSAAFDAKIAAVRADKKASVGEVDESEILANGAKYYKEQACFACHGQNGEGNAIGPNLTDNTWINGCSIDDVMKIIAEGKPTKGMTPYKNNLSEDQINHLAQYILKELVGTSPANAKDAQGEPCTK